MSDSAAARRAVEEYLQTGETAGVLRVLELTALLQQELDSQRLAAVRRAVADHSWSEIGAALRVSKQAAHRKFVKELADELKAQRSVVRRAAGARRPDEVRAMATTVRATAKELRNTRRD